MSAESFWRARLSCIEERVSAGVAGVELHWAFRSELASSGLDAAEGRLGRSLWKELRRRGLVSAPGSRLGERFEHYAAIDPHDEDLCAELFAACFERVFSAARLRKYVEVCADPGWNPDLMILRNLGNFVHELQRKGDVAGTALFEGLIRAAQHADSVGAVTYCHASRRVSFGTESNGPDEALVRECFEDSAALAGLNARLRSRFSGGGRTQLRVAEVHADLWRGLAELARVSKGSATIDDLVRALRVDLVSAPRPDGLDVEDFGHVRDSSGVPCESEDFYVAARCAVERAQGLQARARESLLELLDAIWTAAQAGREIAEAMKQLGWAKQTLSDRRRRLEEVLARELRLPAGIFFPQRR